MSLFPFQYVSWLCPYIIEDTIWGVSYYKTSGNNLGLLIIRRCKDIIREFRNLIVGIDFHVDHCFIYPL